MAMWSVRGKHGVRLALAAVACGLGPWTPAALAQNSDPAIAKALGYLRAHAGSEQVGETGLIALAMIKADVPASDPALAGCMAKLSGRVGTGSYVPERSGGADIYEAAVVALAFSNMGGGEGPKPELAAIASFLAGRQNANGSWDYTHRTQGDTSISQYAVLGLWESENGGAKVAPEVWDRAASWFMSVQSAAGSWNYHRDESGPETLSMTAAGVGSLLICQRQLNKYRRPPNVNSPLLKPIGGENQRRYDPTNNNAKLDAAVKRGLGWLSANFTTGNSAVIGQSPYYGLYGIERIGALAEKDTLGSVNWFDAGRAYINGSQKADGSWESQHGVVPNTAWGVLFLTKSTAKTIKRIQIKQLDAGTLLGGRGLPKDLTNLTVAGGRVVARPMNGAVEGMLNALEDPRGESADKALAGLVVRYRAEGAKALQPHKERFRKLLTDRDPGLRRVAAWSLARTGDLDAVPSLIDALADNDDAVVTVAREGLQLISRKADGFGPPPSSTPEQRQEAAKRWRTWYDGVRPLDLNGADEDEAAVSSSPPAAAKPPAPAAGGPK